MPNAPSPITVNPSALPATLASLARTVLTAIGTVAVTAGWISAESLPGIVTLIITIGTAAYGIWKAFSNSADKAAMVPYVPDDIAKVKP
jgi:hypothetical protein